MTAVLCCLKQQFSDGILLFCPAGAPRVRTVFQRKAVVGQQQKSAAVLFFWRTVKRGENCQNRPREIHNCQNGPSGLFWHWPLRRSILDPVKFISVYFGTHISPRSSHFTSTRLRGQPQRSGMQLGEKPRWDRLSAASSAWGALLMQPLASPPMHAAPPETKALCKW